MTEVNLDAVFSSLEDSASQLNEASETANATLAEAEKRLGDLNIGIEVWYPTPIAVTESEGGVRAHETSQYVADVLGFARIDGQWCFATKKIRRVDGFFEGDTSCPYTNEFLDAPPVPLLKQSRNLRIAALAALPDYLQHIMSHVNTVTTDLEAAMTKLNH